MSVSIKLEAVSLVIVVIIFLFHYDFQSRNNKRYRLFNVCLGLTAGTIATNIITCIMIDHVSSYSLMQHMIMHSLYFLFINSCLSIVAGYVFYLLFEYMPEQHCYKMAITIITTMWIMLILLIVVNIWNGCYFKIENNQYIRGPLNYLGFLVLLIEVGMLCVCYIRNRKVMTPYALKLVRSIPPVVICMTAVQVTFPDTILTGTVAAIVNLILFVCFQSNSIGRDALTELRNRSGFFVELNNYRRKGKNAHIVLVRLRGLDKLNKRYGMKDGDILLYNIARFLENLDSDYKVYRYGNTQFTMLGKFKSLSDADHLTEKIMDRFEETWSVRGKEWKQLIQVVHMEDYPDEIEENRKVEQLEYLLSKEKDVDENTIRFFDTAERRAFERKHFVLSEVRNAIMKESFELYYQPIYSCEEERFTTAEALLRLFTEDGTAISPGEFIPIAEEYNMTDEISWLVLKKCMQFIGEHPELPLDTISINMSVQQMNESYLVNMVRESQREFRKLLYKLRIEITEDVIAQNPVVAANIMNFIRKEGVPFYLDDFGVGYSNFNRIFELPFEVIKLDRSLVKELDKNPHSFHIISSLVDAFHSAGFKVVAEGVETERQVEKAREIGIDRIQGFYYARPMDGESLLRFLDEKG